MREKPDKPAKGAEPRSRSKTLTNVGVLGKADALATAGGLLTVEASGENLGRSAETRKTYTSALRHFGEWAGAGDERAAVAQLLALQPRDAHRLVRRYREGMLAAGAAPASVNVRLAALRRVVQVAREEGLVEWSLDVQGVRVEVLKDTRGPGAAGFRALLKAVRAQAPEKAARDEALVRILHDLGMRRGEVAGLRVVDWIPEGDKGSLWAIRKGRLERTRLGVPQRTAEAIERWMAVHPWRNGAAIETALFVNLHRGGERTALSGNGIWRIVRTLGEKVGLRVRPHGIRHLAITTALDRAAALGIGIEEVLSFSGHAAGSLKLLVAYDDKRGGRQEELARRVSEEAE